MATTRKNGGKTFHADNAKHSALWAGVGVIAVAVCKLVSTGDITSLVDELDHYPQVAGILGVLRIIYGQFGGNTGNPENSKVEIGK